MSTTAAAAPRAGSSQPGGAPFAYDVGIRDTLRARGEPAAAVEQHGGTAEEPS